MQDLCVDYTSGDNKPPNHDVRNKVPCSQFIALSCSALVEILPKVGESVACNVEEVKTKKRGIKGGR